MAREKRERRTVARELPKVGTRLVGRYKGKDHVAVVVQHGDAIAFRVGRKTYPSLSAAASDVTGHATNGWVFFQPVEEVHRKAA